MTCPHRNTRPKPVDLPEPKKVDPDRVIETPSGHRMFNEVSDLIFSGLDPILREMCSERVLRRGIANFMYPDNPKAAAEYRLDYKRFTNSVSPPMREVLMNISEFNRYSTRGPGCRLSELLNNIGRTMCEWLDIPPSALPRAFNCRFGFESTGQDLTDLDKDRKPEVVVIDNDEALDGKVHWADVYAPIVVFEHRLCHNKAFRQCLGFAHNIFYEQPRNFVLCVALLGTHFMVFLFDRSGAYASTQYPLSDSFIVRLVAGLLFGTKSDLGFDLSVTTRKSGQYVRVNGDEYRVKEVLFDCWNVFGPGTVIRVVERDGKEYVNKDVWVNRGTDSQEPSTMKHIRGVKNVVQLENHEVLKNPDGSVVSCEPYREWVIKAKHLETAKFRVKLLDHHQLIMTPLGDRLNSFTSLEELVSALRDIARAIKQLAKRGVYHADVSHKNIVLAPKTDPSAELRKGCLIDFGVSIDHMHETKFENYPRGQLFYMSLDVLSAGARSTSVQHRTYHDFESLLYVLCWECTIHDGPECSYLSGEALEDSIVQRWMAAHSSKGEEWVDAFQAKYTDVKDEDSFEDNVLAHFQPYFRNLIPCARALRNILCQQYTERERMILEERHRELELEKEQRLRDGLPVGTLDWEIDLAWQKVLDSQPFIEREDEVIDAVLDIWDRTLAMIRRKAGKSDKIEDEEEEEPPVAIAEEDDDAEEANKEEKDEKEKEKDEEEDAEDVPEASQILISGPSEESDDVWGVLEKDETVDILSEHVKILPVSENRDSYRRVDKEEPTENLGDTTDVPADDSADLERERKAGEGKEDSTDVSEAAVAVAASPDRDAPCPESDGTEKVEEGAADVPVPESKAGSEPPDASATCSEPDVPTCEIAMPAVRRSKRKRASDEGSLDSGYNSESKESVAETKRRKVAIDSEEVVQEA